MPEERQTLPSISADIVERRRHSRADLPLKARFLGENGEERPCVVINVSAGGALLRATFPPREGELVVLYIDEVGRFEGQVIRSTPSEFAIDYRGRRGKSKRTADALTLTVNNRSSWPDRRVTPRIKTEARAVVKFENGEVHHCSILDISLTGASIEIDPRPPLGAEITLGKMLAKVVRRHEKGVGVVFSGSAKRMEDALSAAADAPVGDGARLAAHFGKKGVSEQD